MSFTLTIRARLIATTALLGLIIVVLGIMGIFGMRSLRASLEDVYTDQLMSTITIDESMNFLARARFAIDRAALHPDGPDVEALLERVDGFLAESDRAWRAYLALPRGVDEDALAQAVSERRDAYATGGIRALADAVRRHDAARIDGLNAALVAGFGDYNAAVGKLNQHQIREARAHFEHGERLGREMLYATLVGIVVSAALIAVSSVALVRAIVEPLGRALDHCAAMGRGDLSGAIVVDRADEMGRLMDGLDQMRRQLAATVHRVRDGSAHVATISVEIKEGNVNLSGRTERQASSLVRTALSLQALSSTVHNNAGNARQAHELAQRASEVAVRGGQLVAEVVATMGDIHASSKQIADIIGVIDGIAFQINILALNAAVEAARAGEHGRSFAVVAGEVRNLAQRSAAAAREIKGLIATSVACVDAGTALVDRAGATMDDIVTSVGRVTAIMGDIMRAGEAQSTGIAQIHEAVTHMDDVTRQNAVLAEQAATAANLLQRHAQALASSVSVFHVAMGAPWVRLSSSSRDGRRRL